MWRKTFYICDGRCGLARCRAVACEAQEVLGLRFGQSTPDGSVRLSTLRCREREGAPAHVMIDDEIYVIEHRDELRELVAGELAQSASWLDLARTAATTLR